MFLRKNIEYLMPWTHSTQLLLVSVLCYQHSGIFLFFFFIQMPFFYCWQGERKHFSPARKTFLFNHDGNCQTHYDFASTFLLCLFVPILSSSHWIAMIYLLIFFRSNAKENLLISIMGKHDLMENNRLTFFFYSTKAVENLLRLHSGKLF